MTRRTKLLIGAAALTLTAFAGWGMTALRAQDRGRKAPTAQEKQAKEKALAEKNEKFTRLYLAAKTTLPAALATVEGNTKGRAHSVEYTMTKDGKLTIEVALFISGKAVEKFVDPDTGKILAAKEEEEGEEDEKDEKDEDGNGN